MRSLLALNHNDGSNALEHLQAAPYDMANPAAGSAPSETFTRRTCVGRRFWLRTGTLRPAAEFQKMLDHAGIVFTDPVRAVARLQLGRALASAGDRMKARAAYAGFFNSLERSGLAYPSSEADQGGVRFAPMI